MNSKFIVMIVDKLTLKLKKADCKLILNIMPLPERGNSRIPGWALFKALAGWGQNFRTKEPLENFKV